VLAPQSVSEGEPRHFAAAVPSHGLVQCHDETRSVCGEILLVMIIFMPLRNAGTLERILSGLDTCFNVSSYEKYVVIDEFQCQG
jgi:hypothetical protein